MRIRNGKPLKVSNIFNYNDPLVSAHFRELFTTGQKRWGDNIFSESRRHPLGGTAGERNREYIESILKPNTDYWFYLRCTCIEYNGEGKETQAGFDNLGFFSNMFNPQYPAMKKHYFSEVGEVYEANGVIHIADEETVAAATYWYWYTNRYTDGTTNKVKFDLVILPLDEERGLTKEYYQTLKEETLLRLAAGEEVQIKWDSYKVAFVAAPKIPAEYQEVEYLESDGDQLIDVGMRNATKYYVKHSFSRLGSGTGRYTLQGGDDTWWGTADNSNKLEYADGSVVTTDKVLVQNTIYEAEIDSTGLLFDGVLYPYERTKNFVNFAIFQIKNYPGFKFAGRIYNMKAYSANSEVIKNLIPCYRKSDNVIGMYDLVSKTFIINQGTGTFIAGPDILNPIKMLPCKVAGGSSDIYYGYNQLVKNGNFVDSSHWTYTNGTALTIENNTATLTATSLSDYDFAIRQSIGDLNANDKYIILFDAKTNSTANKMINIYLSADYVSETTIALLPTVWNNIGKIFSYDTDKTNVTAYFGKLGSLSGLWANGDIIYFKNINIINLTEWYGPGNEPTTVEEFRKDFPLNYYPYSTIQYLNRALIYKFINEQGEK